MNGTLKVTLWRTAALVGVYSFLAAAMGVGFYREVPVNNNPLRHAVTVTSVSGNRLTLADGRVFVMSDIEPARLSDAIRASGGQVELNTVGGFTEVIVKRRLLRCGTGDPLIVIPVLRREHPMNGIRSLGFGKLEVASAPTEAAGAGAPGTEDKPTHPASNQKVRASRN